MKVSMVHPPHGPARWLAWVLPEGTQVRKRDRQWCVSVLHIPGVVYARGWAAVVTEADE